MIPNINYLFVLSPKCKIILALWRVKTKNLYYYIIYSGL